MVSRDRFLFVLFGHPRSSFRFRAQIYQRHSDSVTDPNFKQLSFTLVTSSIILSVQFRRGPGNRAPDSARTFERFDYAVETLFFNGRINVLCNRHFAG